MNAVDEGLQASGAESKGQGGILSKSVIFQEPKRLTWAWRKNVFVVPWMDIQFYADSRKIANCPTRIT